MCFGFASRLAFTPLPLSCYLSLLILLSPLTSLSNNDRFAPIGLYYLFAPTLGFATLFHLAPFPLSALYLILYTLYYVRYLILVALLLHCISDLYVICYLRMYIFALIYLLLSMGIWPPPISPLSHSFPLVFISPMLG